MKFKIIILLFLCSVLTFVNCVPARITVRGRVTCDGKPLKFIYIKLVEFLKGTRDRLLEEGFTTSKGAFYFQDEMQNFTGYNIKVKLWHKCYNIQRFEKRCYYKFTPDLPFGKLTQKPDKDLIYFDLKDIKLTTKGRSGERDCSNIGNLFS